MPFCHIVEKILFFNYTTQLEVKGVLTNLAKFIPSTFDTSK